MDESILVCVRAEGRAWQNRLPDFTLGALLATLATDPANLDDVRRGLQRWMPAEMAEHFFTDWLEVPEFVMVPSEEAVVIDLERRHVDSNRGRLEVADYGFAVYHEIGGPADFMLPYAFPPYWERLVAGEREFADLLSAEDWPHVVPQAGARRVLYDELAAYVVHGCHEYVWGKSGLCHRVSTYDRPLSESLPPAVQAQRQRLIHYDWLMTPRTDLNGQNPRDFMLQWHGHIDLDLLNQQHFWSRRGTAPPSLRRESRAYAESPMGTCEIVLYHRLVHELIKECWQQLVALSQAPAELEPLISQLQRLQQEWLHTPSATLLQKSPAYLVDRERMRLPVELKGDDLLIDCNCPVCQLMADSQVPGFWYLDGREITEYFGADFFAEEFRHIDLSWEFWEEEWENERQWKLGSGISSGEVLADDSDGRLSWNVTRQRADDEPEDGRQAPATPEQAEPSWGTPGSFFAWEIEDPQRNDPLRTYPMNTAGSPWQRSYVNLEFVKDRVPSVARSILGFGIAAHVAELIENLEELDNSQCAVGLHETFLDVRQAMTRGDAASLGMPWNEMAQFLAAVADEHEVLRAKCDDLTAKLKLYRELSDQAEGEQAA